MVFLPTTQLTPKEFSDLSRIVHDVDKESPNNQYINEKNHSTGNCTGYLFSGFKGIRRNSFPPGGEVCQKHGERGARIYNGGRGLGTHVMCKMRVTRCAKIHSVARLHHVDRAENKVMLPGRQRCLPARQRYQYY